MKTEWKKRIEINPDIMGGKPVIKGTRVPVEVIVGSLAGGMTIDEVCMEYRVKENDVRAAKAAVDNAHQLVKTLCKMLTAQGINFTSIITDFGQVQASEDRDGGKLFSLCDHVRGLVLSLLSNQRPWGHIARNLKKINVIFFGYDPEQVQASDPDHFMRSLRKIQCGNRAIVKQMRSLADNIRTFRYIESQYGSLDQFVTSDEPDAIAKKISSPGHYKLKQVGFTLALEYLRNVGIRTSKPDVHVRRALSSKRLGYFDGYPSEQKASSLMALIAHMAKMNPTYIDNLLWIFCAKDYGNICGAKPRCDICGFNSKNTCNFSKKRGAEGSMVTPLKGASQVEKAVPGKKKFFSRQYLLTI